MRLAVACIVAVMPSLAFGANKSRPKCEESPKLVGECFDVRGRLSFYNGNPSFRIWRYGTKRILGVDSLTDDPEEIWFPPAVWKRLEGAGGYTGSVSGTFRVCPLTTQKPSEMQLVCFARALQLDPEYKLPWRAERAASPRSAK